LVNICKAIWSTNNQQETMAFNATLETTNDIAKITLSGDLDTTTAPVFKEKVEAAAMQNPKSLVLIMKDLEYMSSAGLRILIFAKQKMGKNVDLCVVGAQEMVMDTITKTGLHHSLILMDEYDTLK
jgi:anti-anti-sigma factor